MPRVPAALKRQSQIISCFLRGFTTEGCSPLKVKGSGNAHRVFSFGDSSHGALGPNQAQFGDAYEPIEVEGLPDDVLNVAAGHYHSLAVTSSGELWAWGRNVEGQLGRGSGQLREQWNQPQKVQGLGGVHVREAAGSGVVSMAIDSHGYLWAWGKSKRGQLGLGEQVTEAPFPQHLQALSGQRVVQVSLGWGHALACTSEGKLYSWGYSADGRLGFYPKSIGCQEIPMLSANYRNLDEAQLLDLASKQVLEDMKSESELVHQWEPHLVDLGGHTAIGVACGFDHSLVLCERGCLISFGDNTYGQLGRATKMNSTKVWDAALNEQVISINAGLGHSLAIVCGSTHDTGKQWVNQGTAYTWGWNSAFQLGRATCSQPMKVIGLNENEVLRLDGGRVHSVAITLQGQAWTWGSGKNGRLGIGSFSDEHQPCLVESILDWEVCKAVCGMDHTVLLVNERS